MSHDHVTNHPHRPHSVKGVIDHMTHDAYFGEEIDFVVGLTATALTADQVLKMHDSKHHKAMHLAKAGLGAVAATTAFAMMAREHSAEKKQRAEAKERERERERERGRWRHQVRDLEAGYAESLTDSDDDGDRRMVMYRRGTSAHDGGYGYGRSADERSRSPGPPRRAVSHSPVRHREKRSQSYPRLTKFFEAVRDSLEESNRR